MDEHIVTGILELALLGIVVRILAISSGILCFVFGFVLFRKGHNRGKSELEAETKLGKFAASGYGPGALLWALGTIVILAVILSSGRYTFSSNGRDLVMPQSADTDNRFGDIAQGLDDLQLEKLREKETDVDASIGPSLDASIDFK